MKNFDYIQQKFVEDLIEEIHLALKKGEIEYARGLLKLAAYIEHNRKNFTPIFINTVTA